MTTAKGYTEMKDSGIQWIGQIPTHWLLKKAKYCVSITNGSDPKSEGSVPVYGSGSESFKTCGEYKEGPAVLIGRKGATLHIPHYIEGRYWNVDTAFDVKPQEGFSLRYYYYLACVFDYNYYISQTTLPGMTQTNYNNMKLPCPSLDEQSAIAAYLDTQCAKIDEIIDQAKASMEDYKQWKASIIYEAVTKGLNPNVEMKDSGVEWIGKIPVHWAISRIKNIATNLDYLREPISAENRENKLGLYDYYGASGVIDKIDDYNVDDTVLLIGEDGANLRMRNLPLVYRASGKFWVNNHAHILKVKPGCSYGYVAYLLEAGDYNVYITGSAQPKLSQFNLMRFPIVIPDFKEQVQIEKYLDKWCLQIDTLIAEKEDFLIDLESYKKSLIYEVVTGKRRM